MKGYLLWSKKREEGGGEAWFAWVADDQHYWESVWALEEEHVLRSPELSRRKCQGAQASRMHRRGSAGLPLCHNGWLELSVWGNVMYALKKNTKKAQQETSIKPLSAANTYFWALYATCDTIIYLFNANMSSPLPLAHAPFSPVPLAMSMENSTPNWLASVRFSCPGLPFPFLPFVWVVIQGSWKPCPSHAISKCQGHTICCRLSVWSKAIWVFGSNLFVLKTGSKAGPSVLSKLGFRSPIYLFLWSTSSCSCNGSDLSGMLTFSRRMQAAF